MDKSTLKAIIFIFVKIKILKLTITFLFLGALSIFNGLAQDSRDLPKNPQPGHCYVRCQGKDDAMEEWKDIECALVEHQKLSVLTNDELSSRDKKTLDKTFQKFINEGYKLHIQSFFTSVASTEDNIIMSRERVITVANYLVEIGYDPDLIVVNALGPTEKKMGFWYRAINL